MHSSRKASLWYQFELIPAKWKDAWFLLSFVIIINSQFRHSGSQAGSSQMPYFSSRTLGAQTGNHWAHYSIALLERTDCLVQEDCYVSVQKVRIISYLRKVKRGLLLEYFKNGNVKIGYHFYCSIPFYCCGTLSWDKWQILVRRYNLDLKAF